MSCRRDYLEPGMAVCVHHELGLPASCLNLDVTNACCGMVNGMLTVAGMIEAGVVDYALVINAEVAQVCDMLACHAKNYSCMWAQWLKREGVVDYALVVNAEMGVSVKHLHFCQPTTAIVAGCATGWGCSRLTN